MTDPIPTPEPQTKAGQTLWEAIAQNERLSPNGLRMAEYRELILAIEAEAVPPRAGRSGTAARLSSRRGRVD